VEDYYQQTTMTNHYDWSTINTKQQLNHINNYTLLSLMHSFIASANCAKFLGQNHFVGAT